MCLMSKNRVKKYFFRGKNEKSYDFSFRIKKNLIPLHPQNVQDNYVCMVSEEQFAGIAQLVECQPSKLNVASSSLVARSS